MERACDLTSRRWLCGSRVTPTSLYPARPTPCRYHTPQAKVTLVRPVAVQHPEKKPLLVYLPGTDGTGNSITPQLPGLVAAGFDIRSLYITREDRSNWDSLTQQTIPLIRQISAAAGPQAKVTLVAESFGGCLAFRLALAAPELIENMVVVNSATCFHKSYNGVVNLIAATRLLALFPEQLYQVCQAVLVPLLVNKEKIGPSSLKAIKSMMLMEPPLNFKAGSDAVIAEAPAASAAKNSGFAQYEPSGTASWRMNMMTEGNLPDSAFTQIRTKVLLVGSGRDRLLPSMTEQSRLQRLLPNSQRLLLPESGHTALLEADVDLVSIMARTGFLPEQPLSESATALVSQGSNSAARVTSSHQPAGSSNAARATKAQPDSVVETRLGLADANTAQRPLAAALSPEAQTAARVNSSQESPCISQSNSTNGSSTSSVSASPPQQHKSPTSAPAAAAAAARQTTSINDGRSYTDAVSSSRSAQLDAASNIPTNGAAPPSATSNNIEGWVSNNLDSFVSDPSNAEPRTASGNGASSNCSAPTASSPPSDAHKQQQQQQQLSESRRESVNGAGGQRSKQQAVGQKQRLKQGQFGSSGGAWASVDDEMERARQMLSPWRALVAPVVKGTEHLPDPLGPRRPILFVGNHTVIGLYDLPLLVYELHVRGYNVRGLAHPGHWKTPLGPLFQSLGAVQASPMAAYRLLRNSEAVLLFPGGSREVNKRKGEKYKLIWKNKAEFVRLAAKTNALIVPFAAVGGEEAFDIAFDSDEVLANPILGPFARSVSQRVFAGSPLEGSEDAIGPITKLPGTNLPSLVPLPKLERLYFRFMPAVDAAAELPDRNNVEGAEALYSRIKLSVEQGMAEAQQDRQADPERDLGKRLMGQVQRILPSWELLQD